MVADSDNSEEQKLDGRRQSVRRFRAILKSIVESVDGTLRPEQRLVAEQAAALGLWLQGQARAQANGKPCEMGAFVNATNAFQRLLESIGSDVSRRPDDAPFRFPRL